MFVLSTYTIISLPRTPDCVTAEARITEFFGETQTDGRSVRISRGSLGLHGIGVVHAEGILEVALSPTSSKKFCRRQGHQGGVTACRRRRRPDCRRIVHDDAQTSTSAVAKVQGINVRKEELLDSYDGYKTLWSPQVYFSSGRRPQRRRRHLQTATSRRVNSSP